MAEKVRSTQEEEIILVLKREGFKEISEEEVKEEPYRSIYALPNCFEESEKKRVSGNK